MIEFAGWLQATPLSVFIQAHTWITPLLQAIHIVMISVVFVSVAMILLRVLGRVSTDQPFEQVWRRFAPWIRVGLAVMAATGVVLTLGEPVREASALSFWLKMGLIVVAVASIVYLHRALAGHVGTEVSTGMKAAAIGTMIVWIAIVFLGRAIAYDVAVWGTWSFGA